LKIGRLLFLIALGWLVALVGIPLVVTAYRARRPADMPAESTLWVDAPSVPFGFYHGWWLGCWVDSDQHSNRCRLYGPALHPPVVYEGRFLSCDGPSPVPVEALRVKPFSDSADMWVRPNGMAVILRDGRVLVPAESYGDCAKIHARLEEHHELPTGSTP